MHHRVSKGVFDFGLGFSKALRTLFSKILLVFFETLPMLVDLEFDSSFFFFLFLLFFIMWFRFVFFGACLGSVSSGL